jgi:hypothetical protein
MGDRLERNCPLSGSNPIRTVGPPFKTKVALASIDYTLFRNGIAERTPHAKLLCELVEMTPLASFACVQIYSAA